MSDININQNEQAREAERAVLGGLMLETQRFDTFSYGVRDRGASIRIPWQVEVDKKGYLEDRRPNANADPYVIATVMIDTICSAASS